MGQQRPDSVGTGAGKKIPDEQELVRLCKAGHEEALEELVQVHSGRLFRIAYHSLGDHEAALDVVQDSFVRLFQSMDKIDPQRGVSAWLHRVAVNLVIDRLRRKKRNRVETTLREETQGPGGEPAEIAAKESLRRAVWRALDELPGKYRAILVMREIEGMSSKEVARALKCNEATARWRVHRARLLFKEVWERQGCLGLDVAGEAI
jgi:RNA polymerase sigma-70 factor (ECF subfamily)